MSNKTTELNLLCQKLFGKNIKTEVINKEGPDHAPIITAKVILPNETSYEGSGANKILAKENASIKALNKINQHGSI